MMIRGLPEMNIREIYMDNMMIKSRKGADIIEASNISMQQVRLQCEQSSPLINIENSQHLHFDKIISSSAPDLFFSVNGDRSKEIKVGQTDLSSAKDAVIFNYGADKSVFTTIK